jgi:uncharacterized protein (DUF58 family)
MNTAPKSFRVALGWKRHAGNSARKLTFTREGRIVVILAVGIGVAAVNTGNNLLYLLLGWLLSFIIASGVLSEMTMRNLRITRTPPVTVIAGQPFVMQLTIHNDKPRRASYSIQIEDLVEGRPVDKRCYFLKIPAGKSQSASYRHSFSRRGVYSITGMRVSTTFPFGLFRKSRDVSGATEVTVYPPRVAVAQHIAAVTAIGEAMSQRTGRNGEFFGLREHRLGDDRRNVHWRSSARSGRLLVREYEDQRARRISLVLDNGVSPETLAAAAENMPTPQDQAQLFALEHAIATAWSLAARYLDEQWSVQIITRGCHVPFGQGRMQQQRIAHALASLPNTLASVGFTGVVPPRQDSVLIVPNAVVWPHDPPARPSTGSVISV